MKKQIKVLSQTNYFLFWKGIQQPVGSFTLPACLQYVKGSLAVGAKVEDYSLHTSYSINTLTLVNGEIELN